MNISLHGGGKEIDFLQSEYFKDMLEGLSVKQITVCILAVKELADQQRIYSHTKDIRLHNFDTNFLTMVNIDQAQTLFEKSDAIYFGGGSPLTLIRRLNEYHLNRYLTADNLSFIGGGSAGAMAMGELTIDGAKEIVSINPGLGVVPGVLVDSHFSKHSRLNRLVPAVDDLPGILGIGIDEDTVLTLDHNQNIVSVWGEQSVHLYKNGRVFSYDQNDKDLPTTLGTAFS